MSEARRATLARKLRGRVSEPIAVISTACRAPGATVPERLWGVVRDARDMVGDVPADRWDAASFFDPHPGTPGKMITRWAGVVDAVDRFDAAFFGIATPEAMQLDPQQRLALEVAWEAFERADLAIGDLAGSSTGVFLGIMNNDYFVSTYTGPRSLDMYAATGTSHNITAGRLSYFFDLRGPCESVDTACSSSLVAVHRACQSLRTGECDLALAGGVNVIVDPWLNVCLSAMGAISPTGRCRAFDQGADGMVRGDGCGIVVLKRLSDAERDGDRVLAVIAGSAVNHNGRGQGLTAPNGLAHRALIRQALDGAGIKADDIGYVEAHGTGTRLGDPIEMSALADALAADLPRRVPVGSLKTNFGHLESAAGVMSLIKVIEALGHDEIPPQLHLASVNAHIPLEDQPLVVTTERRPWARRANAPRRAGVSAFGLSGTNAHVVIEERARQEPDPLLSERPCVLMLAARSAPALTAMRKNLASFLREHPTIALPDLCSAINGRRSPFEHRVAFFADSVDELRRLLVATTSESAAVQHQVLASVDDPPAVTFVCPDDTTLDLAAMERSDLSGVAEMLRSCVDAFSAAGIDPSATADARSARARAFSIACALAKGFEACGVTAERIVGASGGNGVGEAAAAYLSGSMTLADAVSVCLAAAGSQPAVATAGLALLLAPSATRVKGVTVVGAQSDVARFMVRSLATLQLGGVSVDWYAALGGSRRSLPPLPTYAFERQRYWARISPTRDMGLPPAAEADSAPPVPLGERLRRLAVDERSQVLDDYLRRELSEALGGDVVGKLGASQSLLDAGMTSVLAMSVRNRLQTDLGLKLPLTLVFEHPTLRALVSHLDGALARSE